MKNLPTAILCAILATSTAATATVTGKRTMEFGKCRTYATTVIEGLSGKPAVFDEDTNDRLVASFVKADGSKTYRITCTKADKQMVMEEF